MIRHIFKIIWTERRINIWILFELMLVFCIIWFCVDYMAFYIQRYFEPKGFDIDRVYNINMGIKEEGIVILGSGDDEEKEAMRNDVWTIYERIKKYPEVEIVCISRMATPYNNSSSSNAITTDTLVDWPRFKLVTPEFFDIFKIKIEKGRAFGWDDAVGQNLAVISDDENNTLFGNKRTEEIKTIKVGNHKDAEEYIITGVAEKSKRGEFEPYQKILYLPLKTSNKDIAYMGNTDISIRVKPGTDKDFAERFRKEMQSQISVGHYFLSSVTSADDSRSDYMKWNDFDDNFNSIFSISTFLLINIFLGVLGTFWFRIQSRRSEIGLRIALGASKINVRKMFISETLILLLLSSFIAAIICVNIGLADILVDIGVPSISSMEDDYSMEFKQHIVNYIFTFFILAVISVIGVWYPSGRAAKTQPAQALKDE